MSANRFFLTLIVAGGVATGAIFVGTSLGKSANTEHLDHAQQMRGVKAAKPTMPGQEVFGTIWATARTEVDRRAAIALALSEAAPGDVVLIAGKGHETTQTIGDRVLPFDDRAVVRDVLARRASP